MSYITWSDEYDVGVDLFNEEHKTLIKFVNDLHSGLSAGFSIADMGYILNGLVNYTQIHFKHEEEKMQQFDYPKFPEHKKKHDQLISEVNQFKSQFDSGKKSFSLELLVFLKEWLVNHIQGSDMQYKKFFTGKIND